MFKQKNKHFHIYVNRMVAIGVLIAATAGFMMVLQPSVFAQTAEHQIRSCENTGGTWDGNRGVCTRLPAQCYSGTGDDARASTCVSPRGNTQSSVTYRSPSGTSVIEPENGKCYLLTSPPGQTHLVYTEQPVSLCTDLAEAAAAADATRSRPSDIEADCTDGADAENCGITRYIVLVINVLSALAGIVIAGSIAYGGIQYSMSGSDPQKVSAAKDRIRNAIIALVFFIFGYAFLNYLIPGGVL